QNGYVLNADEQSLFDYVLSLAGHGTSPEVGIHGAASDRETVHAAEWIAEHTRKLNKEQRALKWNALEQILRGYGCTFEQRKGNSLVIRRGNLVSFTGRRNSGDEMDAAGVARIRADLELDEAHGVDSTCFYYNASVVPAFINKYRQLLRRLAAY
ncbi:MAG TPA: hypothetical protein VNM91_11055, partial [Dehalococcoidia bacterium]|nr:hypothetical protein [Dehalococcoidia bacterium]